MSTTERSGALCRKGHAMTPENTYTSPTGVDMCRECRRAAGRRSYERNKRAMGTSNVDKAKCPKGHPYDQDNTYISPGGVRQCRACNRDRQRRLRASVRDGTWSGAGKGSGSHLREKTHCPVGHAYDEANTYVSDGGRRSCRRCRRAKVAEAKTLNPGVGVGGVNRMKDSCDHGHPFNEANTTWSKRGARSCKACKRLWTHRLTQADFDRMMDEQEGKCAICLVVFDDSEARTAACIDHDHACCPGERSCGTCIRGLLCRHCNWGVGNFKDSPTVVDAAAAYLRFGASAAQRAEAE